jgi:TRAP-type mannitol/chloroaromatic compound transport system permease small subunit
VSPDDSRTDPWPLRALDALTQGLNVVGSLLILLLMFLVGVDVAGRNLADTPVAGVPEMVTLSIVAIVFLQIPAALRAGRMTRSDALIDALSRRTPRAGRALETLFDGLGIAVVAVIVYASWPLLIRAWERNDFIGAVGSFTAPTWPVKAMVVLGASMLVLQFCARIWKRHV